MSQMTELADQHRASEATDDVEGRLFAFDHYDDAALADLRERFEQGSPFPHIVLDEFLRLPPEKVVAAFPDDRWAHWRRFEDAYQHQKRTCADIDLLPSLLQKMVYELSGPPFLAFLEKVTGIRGLLPDPYLTGGGLHCSGPGGILAPHADFHVYGKLALFRRINVLLYLNPEWNESYGGCLELFRKGEQVSSASVVPLFGRMVMFLTDDRSIHGITKPVAPGMWRKSLALYYYTSEDTSRFSGDGVTYWQMHGKQRGLQYGRLIAYKALLRGSWTLSKYAHRLNPNFKPGARSVAAEGE